MICDLVPIERRCVVGTSFRVFDKVRRRRPRECHLKGRGRFAVGRESRYEAVEPGARKPNL